MQYFAAVTCGLFCEYWFKIRIDMIVLEFDSQLLQELQHYFAGKMRYKKFAFFLSTYSNEFRAVFNGIALAW
jgi:hypothetical protein